MTLDLTDDEFMLILSMLMNKGAAIVKNDGDRARLAVIQPLAFKLSDMQKEYNKRLVEDSNALRIKARETLKELLQKEVLGD